MHEPSPSPPWLRVDLDDLARRGLTRAEIAGELDAAWVARALDATDATGARAGAAKLDLHLQPDGVVVARGHLDAGFMVPCGRCLADAAVDARTEVCATFLRDGSPRARELGLEPDPARSEEQEIADAELFLYRPPVLDLAPMLAELVALAYPLRALCARGEACRGLCSGCGSDLNELAAEAEACGGCGRLLWDVSQAASDQARAPEAGADAPWKAALRKIREP